MKAGKINLVMDGQFGSAGKGKVVGYLALREKFDFAVCDFMTNAGHWFRSKKHGEFLVQQLPMGALNPNARLHIAAGAAITLKQLFKEIEMFENKGINIRDRLLIDRHAVIIEPFHAEQEALELGRISSTQKGCGAAIAAKALRSPTVRLAQDIEELRPFIGVSAPILQSVLEGGATVLGEMAQGFDLSLNHGFYPFVTSRDITPMAFLSNCGVPPRFLGDVYGVLRTFPIRVGHQFDKDGVKVGDSGPIYTDQRELTWQQLSVLSGKDLLERTTVTQKVRRVFTFSLFQYAKFVDYCDPTEIILNFCNYFPGIDENSTFADLLANGELMHLTNQINRIGPEISLFGTGADDDAMIKWDGTNE